ncbi:hypothetical protein B0T26DRAFT_670349 [Lasiosphaeria miniovina]|uniref:Uncharacterized protein n=1 Tax=Lasiosphaeria miniovina TaxID=1954250 RepID=A0AA40BGW1_9PEZI|nr:uncharacterized protein B0T26DRAFT_670349 [Lasiosphaeria miniovina]KAK0734011.1 hypothetical protein B0T26DRAFT_670349 [Lasiosphaeria miniovina]
MEDGRPGAQMVALGSADESSLDAYGTAAFVPLLKTVSTSFAAVIVSKVPVVSHDGMFQPARPPACQVVEAPAAGSQAWSLAQKTIGRSAFQGFPTPREANGGRRVDWKRYEVRNTVHTKTDIYTVCIVRKFAGPSNKLTYAKAGHADDRLPKLGLGRLGFNYDRPLHVSFFGVALLNLIGSAVVSGRFGGLAVVFDE